MSLKEIVKDSVAILIPCGGTVEPKVLQNAMAVASYSTFNGFTVRQVGMAERTIIHNARNYLAAGFLESECEWAFWLDSDMILEPKTIPVMINWAKKLGAEFLTGVYYQRLGEHRPLIMMRHKQKVYDDEYSHSFIIPNKDNKKPFKVHACGFGCVLMNRTVLEKLEKPYFKYIYFTEKKEVSEDFYFCIEARKKGIDIWCIPELECGHLGPNTVVTRKDYEHKEPITKIELDTGGEK